jgi:hypothetical protein
MSAASLPSASPESNAPAPGYRQFLAPAHPLLREVFSAPRHGREEALTDALDLLRRRIRYRAVEGRRPPEALLRELLSQPGEPVEANCLSLCCLLASRLREVGYGPDEIYVALGGWRNHLQYHAWVLVRRGEGFLRIDPSTLIPEECTGLRIWKQQVVHVLFNDRHVHVLEAEKRRLLVEAPSPSVKPRKLLFGRNDPAIVTVLADRRFDVLVAGLFAGAADFPEETGPLAERALAHGLLRREAERLLPGPRMVLIPDRPEGELAALFEPALDRYLGVMSAVVPEIRQAFEECAASRRFPWDEAGHALAAGLLMDLSVGRQLFARHPELRPQLDPVIWIFERPRTRNAFGVQFAKDPESGWALVQLWHRGLQRPALNIRDELAGFLGRLASGDPGDADAPGWLHLRYVGLVRRKGRSHELLVPSFTPEEWRRLATRLQAGAGRLVEEAILPALSLLPGHPFWGDESATGRPYTAVRLLLDCATDRVVDSGLLPAFPPTEKVSPAWGRLLWNEDILSEARFLYEC